MDVGGRREIFADGYRLSSGLEDDRTVTLDASRFPSQMLLGIHALNSISREWLLFLGISSNRSAEPTPEVEGLGISLRYPENSVSRKENLDSIRRGELTNHKAQSQTPLQLRKANSRRNRSKELSLLVEVHLDHFYLIFANDFLMSRRCPYVRVLVVERSFLGNSSVSVYHNKIFHRADFSVA